MNTHFFAQSHTENINRRSESADTVRRSTVKLTSLVDKVNALRSISDVITYTAPTATVR